MIKKITFYKINFHLIPIFFSSIVFASDLNEKPFWVERSSWIEGDNFMATGVATHVKTIEEGRERAYQNGIKEIGNYYPSVTYLNLPIVTQMTYEEQNKDGTLNVYRLLKIHLKALKNILQKITENNDENAARTLASVEPNPPNWRIYTSFGWSGALAKTTCAPNNLGQGNSYCTFIDIGIQRQITNFLGLRIDYRHYFDSLANPSTSTPIQGNNVGFSNNEFGFRVPIYPSSQFYISPEMGLSQGSISSYNNSVSIEQHYLGGAIGTEQQIYKVLGGYVELNYRNYNDASGYQGKNAFQGSFGFSFGW